MPSYNYTHSAEHDVNDIIDYTLQTWGENQAITYMDGLENLAQSLAQTPKMGKACDTLYKGLPGFPYEKHCIYYLEAAQGITIVRVLHKSMNPSLHVDALTREEIAFQDVQ